MKSADILIDDVLGVIFDFIPITTKRMLNKQWHNKYTAPNPKRMNTFMRAVIRHDQYFIFEYYLTINYTKWRKISPWLYKNMKFHNYIEFIRYLCCEHTSGRCQCKLKALEDKLKPNRKKKYKKMKIRSIRWNN